MISRSGSRLWEKIRQTGDGLPRLFDLLERVEGSAVGFDQGVRVRVTTTAVAGLPPGAVGTVDRDAYAASPDAQQATFGYWVRFDGRDELVFVAEDDLEPAG